MIRIFAAVRFLPDPERLDGWTAANDREMSEFVGGGLGQVPDLITETRSTLRMLNKLIEDLRETPSSIVYQPEKDAIPVEE